MPAPKRNAIAGVAYLWPTPYMHGVLPNLLSSMPTGSGQDMPSFQFVSEEWSLLESALKKAPHSYRQLQLLCEGGMGVLYKCMDSDLPKLYYGVTRLCS